jgi:hypothetical protein
LWLVAGGWFFLREKYCWLVADKPSEQARCLSSKASSLESEEKERPYMSGPLISEKDKEWSVVPCK